jgi:hypothetical protein
MGRRLDTTLRNSAVRCSGQVKFDTSRRRRMKKRIKRFIWIMVLGLSPFIALQAIAAQGETPNGSQGVTGSEGSEESNIEPQNIAPRMGMREEWRRVPRTLAGKIYLWERYILEHRHDLGSTLNQEE